MATHSGTTDPSWHRIDDGLRVRVLDWSLQGTCWSTLTNGNLLCYCMCMVTNRDVCNPHAYAHTHTHTCTCLCDIC